VPTPPVILSTEAPTPALSTMLSHLKESSEASLSRMRTLLALF
jgi:hypothetical protein